MNATKRHVSVAAFLVMPGDEMEHGGERVTVTNQVLGQNGQRYVVTETVNGTITVHEFDPGQKVSVWR